ncbi:hypothetical protein [Geomesophilobacter sediminis]|uniref:Uncharacterized protein n=1 Tax=Geomesophilobacter sediminis TaxID=2798584 RepID=A0A8J7M1P5_9BACT|nr:hypothetical protein [Geomesophilobacter sediminis]MBJ6726798.1 hypothetical protein [Geomesophilobacter sediminis]
MECSATIAEVEEALSAFKAAAEVDSGLEAEWSKKLWAITELLTLNEKDLKQAYTNAEKWWSVRAIKQADGCTVDPANREKKMKERIHASSAWVKSCKTPLTKTRAERWMANAFKAESGTNRT